MTEITINEDEKKRIEEEEKVRVEAREKAKKELKNKKQTQGCVGCLAIIALIAIASILSSRGNKETNLAPRQTPPQKQEEQEKEPTAEEHAEREEPEVSKTFEETVKDYIAGILGEETNTGKESVRQVLIWEAKEVLDSAPEGSKSVWVDFNANDNLTTKSIRSEIQGNIGKIFKGIFNFDNTIYDVLISAYFPTVDAYGNEGDSKVMVIGIQRPTAEKINWENFDRENFPIVADDYWEHPLFEK